MKNSASPLSGMVRLATRRLGFLRQVVLLVVLAEVFSPPPLDGIIFYYTADPSYNTTAPTGPLANSGWQWVGIWGGFQGTAIGPHDFLAAKHVGGTVGDPFVLQGVSYRSTAFIDARSTGTNWKYVTGFWPVPSGFFATRVSVRTQWIDSVLSGKQ